MTTQAKSRARRLEAPLGSLLARLRRRIRAYIWADGLALVLATVGISFWASLVLDWSFEPPGFLRVFVLVVASVVLATVAFRFLLARLMVRLADRNMALLVERRFGQFRDSLLTAVELSERPEHAAEFNADMLAHTHHDALAHSAGVDLGEIFNPAPLARHVSLAAALVTSVLVFVVLAPNVFGIWARRNLLLSDELWPRKTHLVVEGFDERGAIKIARGSDWNLLVKAEAALGREIPEIVEVRYSTSDGARSRENMSREGVVVPGQAPFQTYSHTFKGVLAALEFYVRGGDDRQGPYHLLVVDSPTISRMTLHCEYPAYMRRAVRDLPVAGLMQVPRGTEISIRAEANKPLVAVQVDDTADENTPSTHRMELAQEHGQPQTSFGYNLARLDGDKALLFTLFDADGIRSREAVRLAIAAVADEPPQVNVQLKGIGTAITAAARLPASGEVSDDYGVTKVWFDYRVDDRPASQQPFETPADGRQKLAVQGALEVRDLQLQPKQKLHWSVQAADSFALAGGPNVGTSQRYVLDVVTPEQLRSMLEARELMLRRRFETIIEELTETRNLLASIATGSRDEPAQGEPAEGSSKPGEAEPSGESNRRGTLSPAVQVERVLQNSQRSSHETLQVAQAFDEIREEMINNRVDTEELKTRLKDGVADPLRRIVDEMFPQWEGQLKQLASQLASPQAAPAQAAAIAQGDAILVEMKAVLDKMLELETFNEVLDMLRQIISAQEKVSAETKQKQKQKLRDLVE